MRRKDTTKGPPLRILSLDGGGVRGYSMLIILQELMHRTFVEIEGRAPKRHEIPRPCDHFDLIAGTGTGGLIAIMLGRLRLDLDTCKDLYVHMTRRVFETDKTFAGIPYRSTMFKASKLEEAIREVVRKHTVSEQEGNDTLANATPMSPETAGSDARSINSDFPQRTLSQSSRYSQMGASPIGTRLSIGGALAWGNPNALLYDTRETRTKTAVTAVMRGTSQTALLRSYDSRKETAAETQCSIWQAGRATCATAMAFKPIQIGQSQYLDEGDGKYNPAPMVLDEAAQNEWPGREVGVFVSIGTGKRPPGTNKNQHEWWEGFMGGSMGDFAEARRRLISKLEGCEDTHQYMLRDHLSARGVNAENYFRLNVEIGVGDFGMNEWARLSEISTNTRLYLSKQNVENINQGAASKMARIHFAKIRHERAERHSENGNHAREGSWQNPWDRPLPVSQPLAAELPGDGTYYQTESFRPGSGPHDHRPSVTDQKYTVVVDDQQPPQAPPESANPRTPTQRPAQPATPVSPPSYYSPGSLHAQRPYPDDYPVRLSFETNPSPRPSYEQRTSPPQPHLPYGAPPLPPKTPINGPDHQQGHGPRTFMNMGDLGKRLPYPDIDGPPPTVNTANKPQA